MVKAFAYIQKHWAVLVLFLDDEGMILDTKSVKRMFKMTILSRKSKCGQVAEASFE
jgi:hypothetical protein|tara:strand:- start:994 stop:1161 length:168 start_codon:yes stop_codon:yes gene_type:complete